MALKQGDLHKSRPDRQSDIRYRDDSNRPAFICRADTVRGYVVLPYGFPTTNTAQ